MRPVLSGRLVLSACVLSACLAAGSLCPLFAFEQPSPEWASQGVIALNHSLNARMHPLPVSALRIPDGFWAVRRKPGAERILPGLLDLMEEHGLLDNFRRVAGKKNVPRKGRATSDADVYQWIEAAAWLIASPDASNLADKQRIQARLEPVITDVIAAQDASGYLDTFYSAEQDASASDRSGAFGRRLLPSAPDSGGHRGLSRDGRPPVAGCFDSLFGQHAGHVWTSETAVGYRISGSGNGAC